MLQNHWRHCYCKAKVCTCNSLTSSTYYSWYQNSMATLLVLQSRITMLAYITIPAAHYKCQTVEVDQLLTTIENWTAKRIDSTSGPTAKRKPNTCCLVSYTNQQITMQCAKWILSQGRSPLTHFFCAMCHWAKTITEWNVVSCTLYSDLRYGFRDQYCLSTNIVGLTRQQD